MHDLERAAARMMCVGFDGTEVSPSLRELIGRGVRSVILFTRNYESKTQLAALCREIKLLASEPIMICVDQEGGRVQRFREPFTLVPSMREIGRRGDVSFAREIGRTLASELRSVNIDMNLAPVLDVDSNPQNPVIGERAFGPDPAIVRKMGCAIIDAMQRTTECLPIAACAKHFPGHGDTSTDSHLDLPTLTHDMERIRRIELPPFAAAIEAAVASIMVAHVLFSAIDSRFPASMSHSIITDLLRNELKYVGLIVSDDLEMNAIVNHFGIDNAIVLGANAGIDLFCICHDPNRQHGAIDALVRAAQAKQVPLTRLRESSARFDRFASAYVRKPVAAPA